MIKTIKIKNVASYKEEVSLETDKPINLIYGLNGTGKTILSRFLSDYENENFKDCSLECRNDENLKILVYNQDFIDENFYNVDTQKGIFTLGKENKEAEEIIKLLDGGRNYLRNNLNNALEELETKDGEIEENKTGSGEKIWKIVKPNYTDNNAIFDKQNFLEGFKGSKIKLLNKIRETPYKQNITKTINELRKELEQIKEVSGQRELLNEIECSKILEIENKNVFEEIIVGDNNSSIAKLIKELDNSSWVRKGLEYLPKDITQKEKCPFCQEQTITQDLANKIKNYFDEEYERKIEHLRSIKEEYETYLIKEEDYAKDFLEEEERIKLELSIREFNDNLKRNLNKVEDKIITPNIQINIMSSEGHITRLNELIKQINKSIQSYNDKIKKMPQTIENIKNKYWEILRKDYNVYIDHYEGTEKKLKEKRNEIAEKIKGLKADIVDIDKDIGKQRTKTRNIQQSINNINKNITSFGMIGFRIEENKDSQKTKLYRIVREDGSEGSVFKNLSEGEKTIISFLYFVELCKGTTEDKDDHLEKIIVIDDPVSSLSHTHVFNVGELIKREFLSVVKEDGEYKLENKRYKQHFVLTHNLYFFDELMESKDHDRRRGTQKLFRMARNEKTTSIKEMKPDEIQNDYHAYWTIINDDNHHKILIANTMRQIIERFFGFMEKKDLNSVFNEKKLKDDIRYKAFKRFINRESHSFSQNIFDSGEFDYDNLQEIFKEVFEKTGNKKHYEKMKKIN